MMTGDMFEPRPCIVEVIRIVPADDVPVVAARVAERLGMPVERVRKLIDGRTGPITKALRPDKADAIAQTFEAAGVAVVIRPADEDDDPLLAAPPAMPTDADAASQGGSASASDEAEGDTEADEPEPEPEAEPEPREEREAEASDDDGASAGGAAPWSDAEAEYALEADLEPDDEAELEADLDLRRDLDDDPQFEHDLDLEPEFEPEFEPELEPDLEPDDAPELEPDIESDLDLAPVDEAERDVEYDLERDREDDLEPDLEHDLDLEPDVEHDLDLEAGVAAVGETDDVFDVDEGVLDVAGEMGDDIGELPEHRPLRATEPRWPTGLQTVDGGGAAPLRALRLDPDADDDDETNDPGAFGLPARGEVLVRPRHEPPLAGAGDKPAATPAGRSDVERLVSGGHRLVRADAPAEPMTTPSGNADGAAAASGGASPFGDPSTWSDDADGAAWSIGERAKRRLEVVTDDEVEPSVVVPDDVEAERPRGPFRELPLVRSSDPGRTLVEHEQELDDLDDAADATPASPATVTGPSGEPVPIGRAARRPRRADDGGGQRTPRPVPQPRAVSSAAAASAPVDETLQQRRAERVTRRRTLMLVTLAIALGLFVLAQAWVSGRAAPAFDAGLHRFRDADFGSAQRVWVQLAERGDHNAQFMVGYLSEAGLGRPWSARAAAAWYRMAADAGHAEAQWRLAGLYEQGLGVPYDLLEAERWWAAAANGGHAQAAFRLATARLERAASADEVALAAAAFERATALGWPAARAYRDAIMAGSSGAAHADALP